MANNNTQRTILLLVTVLSFPIAFHLSLRSSIHNTTTGGLLHLLLPPSTTQRFRDNNNLKYLPPNHRHGSDLPLPSALAGDTSRLVLEPTMGHHRPKRDAVFAITDEGMELNVLVLFVTSLRDSGFRGDIVLSAPKRESMKEGVYEFLRESGSVVVYEDVVEFEQQQLVERPEHHSSSSTTNNNANNNVYLKGLYGDGGSAATTNNKTFEDPRKNRHVGVARFELFWAWSTRYESTSKILLVDANDTFFQPSCHQFNLMDGCGIASRHDKGGRNLYLYEGSKEKEQDMKHMQNQTMIPTAYSKKVLAIIHSYAVLIPSTTHGDQAAIEVYLRAMVNQFDDTQCGDRYCDWAFHNYLYYFGVLKGAPGIDNIIISQQGDGSVNSLGGNQHIDLDLDNGIVYNRKNWQGRLKSWAVHQYNRNETLKSIVDKKAEDMVSSRRQNYKKVAKKWKGKYKLQRGKIAFVRD